MKGAVLMCVLAVLVVAVIAEESPTTKKGRIHGVAISATERIHAGGGIRNHRDRQRTTAGGVASLDAGDIGEGDNAKPLTMKQKEAAWLQRMAGEDNKHKHSKVKNMELRLKEAHDRRKELQLKEAALQDDDDSHAMTSDDLGEAKAHMAKTQAEIDENLTTARQDAANLLNQMEGKQSEADVTGEGDKADKPEAGDKADKPEADVIGEARGKADTDNKPKSVSKKADSEGKSVPMATKEEADDFLASLGITDDDVNALEMLAESF